MTDKKICGTGALEGVIYDPDTGCMILNDRSKLHHHEDGRLLFGNIDGQHLSFSRHFQGGDPGAPSLAQQLHAEGCYHGSTKEAFDVSFKSEWMNSTAGLSKRGQIRTFFTTISSDWCGSTLIFFLMMNQGWHCLSMPLLGPPRSFLQLKRNVIVLSK